MTDDLTAAVARLREYAGSHSTSCPKPEVRTVLAALASAQASEKIAEGCHGIAVRQRDSAWRECESLRAALEAAQADAMRYRWLRDQRRLYWGPIVGELRDSKDQKHILASISNGPVPINTEMLDAAIDAAMGADHA